MKQPRIFEKKQTEFKDQILFYDMILWVRYMTLSCLKRMQALHPFEYLPTSAKQSL